MDIIASSVALYIIFGQDINRKIKHILSPWINIMYNIIRSYHDDGQTLLEEKTNFKFNYDKVIQELKIKQIHLEILEEIKQKNMLKEIEEDRQLNNVSELSSGSLDSLDSLNFLRTMERSAASMSPTNSRKKSHDWTVIDEVKSDSSLEDYFATEEVESNL